MMKNYRPKNIAEFVRIVRPASYRAALTMHQESEIKQWIDRHGHYWEPGVSDALINDRNLNREQLDLQKEAIIALFEEWPDYYWQFLVDSGTLDPPEPLIICRTLRQLEKRLNPIPPAPYLVISMSGSYNNKIYSNAISLLQEKLNVRVNGIYDWDTAVAVSKKIGNVVPAGVGYFAHEVHPQMMFRYDDIWLVYGIDRDLWLKLGMDENDLVPDDAEHWEYPSVTKKMGMVSSVGGTAFEEIGNTLKAKSKKGYSIDAKVINSLGELGKVLKRFNTVFQFAEPIEENLTADEIDMGKMVKELGIVGGTISVAGPISAGIIGWMTLQFKLDDGTSWFHTFRNIGVKGGTETGVFATVGRTIEWVFTQEFWDMVNDYLRKEHRKDLEAGIRMD